MSSSVYVLLVVAVLAVAYFCRDRRSRQHLAETPLAVALRKPTPEDPKHRVDDGPGIVQQAVVLTPAVGLALVVAGSNALVAPTNEPVTPTTATITVVPASTPADATSVPIDNKQEVRDLAALKRQLMARKQAMKKRVSRTVRRTHKTTTPAKPTPVVKPHPVTRVPAPRKPVVAKPAPKPAPVVKAAATGGIRDRIISIAKTQLGLPYVYGAEKPGVAFDCSGLTEWVFSKVGINLPRTSQDQYRAARRISTPQPGDLVFYLNSSGAYHVGIFYKPGYMIVAPHTGTDVQVETIWGSPVYATVL